MTPSAPGSRNWKTARLGPETGGIQRVFRERDALRAQLDDAREALRKFEGLDEFPWNGSEHIRDVKQLRSALAKAAAVLLKETP